MSEVYTVLSPWTETDNRKKLPINPRLDTLKGKTIGLYASFKEYHPFFMQEVERQRAERYPTARFSHYTYIVDTHMIMNISGVRSQTEDMSGPGKRLPLWLVRGRG